MFSYVVIKAKNWKELGFFISVIKEEYRFSKALLLVLDKILA